MLFFFIFLNLVSIWWLLKICYRLQGLLVNKFENFDWGGRRLDPIHSILQSLFVRPCFLVYFPHVLSRKEYTEARKSRRCGKAGRLAQAQVQTTPPRGKAGRGETEHRSRCWPRLATSFTCLASCPIHPRVSSTSFLLLHSRWNLLMHLHDVTYRLVLPSLPWRAGHDDNVLATDEVSSRWSWESTITDRWIIDCHHYVANQLFRNSVCKWNCMQITL